MSQTEEIAIIKDRDFFFYIHSLDLRVFSDLQMEMTK